MSIDKPSRPLGKEFSRQEAHEILEQCIAIRLSLDELEDRAIDALMAPELRLVVDNE
jgi:hypothetical protein